MSRNRFFLLFFFQVIVFAACADHRESHTNAAENMYATDSADIAMNKAMDIARSRFDVFDRAFESGKYDQDKFSIKVKYPHRRGNEYIWLVNIT